VTRTIRDGELVDGGLKLEEHELVWRSLDPAYDEDFLE
jgi:hypothetical protein